MVRKRPRPRIMCASIAVCAAGVTAAASTEGISSANGRMRARRWSMARASRARKIEAGAVAGIVRFRIDHGVAAPHPASTLLPARGRHLDRHLSSGRRRGLADRAFVFIFRPLTLSLQVKLVARFKLKRVGFEILAEFVLCQFMVLHRGGSS